MPAIVLTYHSVNLLGHDYARNDHVALASDLPALTAAGWQIRPLADLVEAWQCGQLADRENWVALTFDDGCMLDARDAVHPTLGPQRSFLNLMRDFAEAHPRAQPRLHATSFVIASPAARVELDQRDYMSLDWWGDNWWAEAEASGLMRIESHSWDHNHTSLEHTAMQGPRRFDTLATRDEARDEIEQANGYIAAVTGRAPRMFAYPWGQVSPYLADDYFPNEGAAHRLSAAFTTEPAALDTARDKWRLPRFVCGEHWRSADAFAALLAAHSKEPVPK